MTEPRLSPTTKALLLGARRDGPGASGRAKVWSAVSGAIDGVAGGFGGGGPQGATSMASGGAGAGGAKMLLMGTLLGGTVTVGLASVLLTLWPAPSPPAPDATRAAFAALAAPASRIAPAVTSGGEVVSARTTEAPASKASPAPHASAGATSPSRRPSRAAPSRVASPAPSSDLLGQEVAFVDEARSALARGDARDALRAIQAARALPSHRLAPEELSVQAQALHAIGREDEAKDADSVLRSQFPESALAR